MAADEGFTFERYGKLILDNLQSLTQSVKKLADDLEVAEKGWIERQGELERQWIERQGELERRWAAAEAARLERERLTKMGLSLFSLLWGTLGGGLVAFFSWLLSKH